MIGGGTPNEVGIAQRRSPEHDPVDPKSQPVLDCILIADAAAKLHAKARCGADRRDRGGIPRASGKGAVKIDHVKPRETGVREPSRLSRRILAEDSGGRQISANEADAGAFLDIDRRKQNQGCGSYSSRSL